MGPSMVRTHCKDSPNFLLLAFPLIPGSWQPNSRKGLFQTGGQLSLRNGQISCDETGQTGKDSETLDGSGSLLGKERERQDRPSVK